jgi:TolA-binding protein
MDTITDPENQDGSTTEVEDTTTTTTTSTQSQQSVDWEARYIGLQKASEKKRTQLESSVAEAQKKLDDAIAQLEELKTSSTDLSKVRDEAEQAKTKLETDLQALRVERDNLSKQIAMKDLVIKEFPDLVPLIGFLPAAESEEKLREYAGTFSTALKSYIEKGVKSALEGSSPPATGGTTTLPTSDEGDRLYDAAVKLAGVSGKEKEAREAKIAWETFMANKTQTA